MGYYSRVAIRLSQKAYNKLKRKKFLPDSPFRSFDTFHFLKDETVLFQWNDVKWYDGYDEEVDAVMDFLRKLDENSGEFYEYLRIGEDSGDGSDGIADQEHDSTFPYEGEADRYALWIERTVGILESRLGGRMDGMKELMELEGIKKED